MIPGKKIFFASDLHLGAPDYESSLIREKHFVNWLDQIADECAELYLLGDVFDFWFDYGHAVPAGYVRILGKLAELSDRGIPIHYFAGNHDLWIRNYFRKELGASIYFDPVERSFFGKKFFIHHGDGLGPGDHMYKLTKKVFTNKFLQWCYRLVHPDIGIPLASFFSRRSRKKTGKSDDVDYGNDEFLLSYCKEKSKDSPEIDYFVFGHRHKPFKIEISDQKYYYNLGDWIKHFSFLEVSEDGCSLRCYNTDGTFGIPDISTGPGKN